MPSWDGAQQWHEQALHAALADVHSQRARQHAVEGQVFQLQQLQGYAQQQQQQRPAMNTFNLAAFDATDAAFDAFAPGQMGGAFSSQNLVLNQGDAGLSFLS